MNELYRLYRPKVLDRIIGNRGTVEALREKLKKKKVPHVILFSGPSGCGKTTLARVLSVELNAAEMDIVELNCSSFRGIDTIREIERCMKLAPTKECRIWILDEVHQLSKEAQNAALKMLEDTPDHVYFFLCTTDPVKLLPTLRNRCSPMPVEPLSEKQVRLLLERVSRKANIQVTEEALSAIEEKSGGSARQALVLLDKVRHVSPKEQVKAIGVADEESREAIDLCRLLIKRARWSVVGKTLRALQGDPESIRWAVLGYARAVLLSQGSQQAYSIICAFERPFFDSKEAGLARACFEAIHGD